MSNVADDKRNALMTALVVTEGNIDDLEILWLQVKGATSDQVNEAWVEVFQSELATETLMTGTVVVSGTADVIGSSTLFTTELKVGDKIRIQAYTVTILSIEDDTHLTLTADFPVSVSSQPFWLQNVAAASFNDLAHAYLGSLGHTGALPDRWASFWAGTLP